MLSTEICPRVAKFFGAADGVADGMSLRTAQGVVELIAYEADPLNDECWRPSPVQPNQSPLLLLQDLYLKWPQSHRRAIPFRPHFKQ
jgi:hypothetical protein